MVKEAVSATLSPIDIKLPEFVISCLKILLSLSLTEKDIIL